jgi:hypothetical protein
MSNFGNNTLALVLILSVIALLEEWNAGRNWRIGVILAFCASLLPAFSATLALPMALAGIAWIVARRVVALGALLKVSLPIAVSVALLLKATNVLGASSAVGLALTFDRGQFLQNVAFGMAPTWSFVLLSMMAPSFSLRRFHWFILAGALFVPTFLKTVGVGSLSDDLSMKTASMIAVASIPAVAAGLSWLVETPRPWYRLITGILCLGGLSNAASYVLQFPVRAATFSATRATDLPEPYADALLYVRRISAHNAIVADPFSGRLTNSSSTLFLAERRNWFHNEYMTQGSAMASSNNVNVTNRLATWTTWKDGAFVDARTSHELASQVDYLISDTPISSADWIPVASFARYLVYQSTARASVRSD